MLSELAPSLPIVTILWRGTLICFLVAVLFRVLPKRNTGANSPNDLLALVIIGGLMADAISSGSEKSTDYLLLGLVVLGWDFSFNFLEFHFPALSRWMVERPTVIVRHGRYLRRAMRNELITQEEVLSCLRREGLESVEQVARATVESSGEITVIRSNSAGVLADGCWCVADWLNTGYPIGAVHLQTWVGRVNLAHI